MEIAYSKLEVLFCWSVATVSVRKFGLHHVFSPSDFDEVTRAWWRLIGFCENRNGSGEMRPVTDKSESGEWEEGSKPLPVVYLRGRPWCNPQLLGPWIFWACYNIRVFDKNSWVKLWLFPGFLCLWWHRATHLHDNVVYFAPCLVTYGHLLAGQLVLRYTCTAHHSQLMRARPLR